MCERRIPCLFLYTNTNFVDILYLYVVKRQIEVAPVKYISMCVKILWKSRTCMYE